MKPVHLGWLSMPNWARRMSGQGKSEMKLALKEIDTRIENYALFLSNDMLHLEIDSLFVMFSLLVRKR